jgi:hypothetical protein
VGEILPSNEPNPCGVSLLPPGDLLDTNMAHLTLFIPPTFSINPSVSLKLSDPSKQVYRVGETVQLKITTTAGEVYQSSETLTTLFKPSVAIFLWVVRPDSSVRYYYLDSTNSLRESSLPTPIVMPSPAVNYTWNLPSIMNDPLQTPAGSYTWKAAIYRSETLSESDLLADGNSINFQFSSDRPSYPSVIAISTPLFVYKPGDQMVIIYSTRKGTTAGQYDLMLRLTSRGTGSDYYFYDDANDTNRWIHSSVRPMQTLVPQDESYQIPTNDMPPISIADDTPSGTFDMKAYFSMPGKNVQVGEAASSTFTLDTPAAPNQCFIATAAFGSGLGPSVMTLRQFRDRVLLRYRLGREFVNLYYRYSPGIAAMILVNPFARKIVRAALRPAVLISQIWMATGITGVILMLGSAMMLLWLLCRRHPRITALILLLIVSFGVAQAAEIRGSVVQSQPFPAPVVGATIALLNTSLQTTSGPDGTFRFSDLPTGTYQIQASAPAYQSTSVQTSLNSLSSMQDVVLPITPTGARTYEYYLSHTSESDVWWTYFAITNSGYTGADVAFVAFDELGNYLGKSSKLTHIEINQQVGGSPSSFFAADVISKAAWYKFTSSAPLEGVEMFGDTIAGTLAAFPLSSPTTQSLYIPHVAVSNWWWTGISVVSGWVRGANVRLDARDGLGNILATGSRIGMLKPGQKSVGFVQSFFGWDYPPATQWLSVQSDGPITGFELFSTRDLKMMAAVPATGKGARRLFFPHILVDSNWWTGIAMLNVGGTPTNVELRAYDINGRNVTTSRAVPLAPSQRTVGMIDSYFDKWPSGVKYVEAISSSDIIAYEVISNPNLNTLAGMAAITETGTELVFPFVESDSNWETSIQFINTSSIRSQATLDAYDASGTKVAEIATNIDAGAAREGTIGALFGQPLSNARFIRLWSDGGALIGYCSFKRLNGQGLTDFPAQLIQTPIDISSFLTVSINPAISTPSISSISPSTPTASSSNQTLTVYGSQFQSGLTVTVGFPGGGSTTLSGSQIQSVTAASFQMIITLNGSGAWTIKVNNPDGGQSNTFSFAVATASPSISSILPASPIHGSGNQTITVYGNSFQSGLTVTAFFPSGGSTALSGSQIQSVTVSSFQMIITLNSTGSWGIRVNNPDDKQSNTLNFNVQ